MIKFKDAVQRLKSRNYEFFVGCNEDSRTIIVRCNDDRVIQMYQYMKTSDNDDFIFVHMNYVIAPWDSIAGMINDCINGSYKTVSYYSGHNKATVNKDVLADLNK